MNAQQTSACHRIALVIQYLGTNFHGWQRQPNQRTVQEELEKVIASVLQYTVTVHAAGRTDAGVHAAAQVAHFDATGPIPAHRWVAILNSRLPDDILIRSAAAVPHNWHARFSACWRRYRYTLYTDALPNVFIRPFVWHYYHTALDVTLMHNALLPLLGRHHLSAFQRSGSKRPHAWVDVQGIECYRQGAFIYIEVQASGFLYGMMRLLVGLLVQVGQGMRSPLNFTEIWQMEQRDQVKYSAPAKGLCLLRVGYPESPFATEAWFNAQPQFLFGTHDSCPSTEFSPLQTNRTADLERV
jgi:tRNA pseudouridine38-40 synthase